MLCVLLAAVSKAFTIVLQFFWLQVGFHDTFTESFLRDLKVRSFKAHHVSLESIASRSLAWYSWFLAGAANGRYDCRHRMCTFLKGGRRSSD